MSNEEIFRAWKDEDYSHSLSEEMRSQLPENPVGMVEEVVELTPSEQEELKGGFYHHTSWLSCPKNTILPNGICIDPAMTFEPCQF